MSSRLIVVALVGLLAACAAVQQNQGSMDAGAEQPTASPDWRDQIIYFAMVDRFEDGDPGNNDQGAGEYDPSRGSHYSGGDLRGLTRRIEYIQALGATTLWITPPVANQWWNPTREHTGYHGYWARDFMAVDAHYGTLADYQELASALHARQMYLVQDIVVNHVGDYFGYDGGFDAADPTLHFELHADADGRSAPTQAPFDLNDVRDPDQRAAAIYHFTPDISNFADPEQEASYQMSGLDDLNTDNPRVRAALRESYGYWIREVGVDGFRVDTAFYVKPAFFEDFLFSADPDAPGIDRVARANGKDRFHAFGEGFAMDAPGSDAAMRKIDSYMRGHEGQPRMPGMINFPLYGSLVEVFARGRPTANLAERVEAMMRIHAQPWLMPSFIDNHDVDRFLAGGSDAALRQALLAMLTLPGIPTIYYGTEQGFREPRAAMFAAGYGSGGINHFDTASPLYRYLKAAITLRREHPLFSRGTPEILYRNPSGAGALAWRMRHEDNQAIVVFNTSDSAALLDHLPTELAPGTQLQGLFAIDGTAPTPVVDASGQISLVLAPRSGYVWQPSTLTAAIAGSTAEAPLLEPLQKHDYHEDFEVSGSASGPVQLVVDGQLTQAQMVKPDGQGRWQARIDTSNMLDPGVTHHLVVWDGDRQLASPRIDFRVRREWQLLADVTDPPGDDHGPNGRYQYPDQPGWRDERPGDIERIRVLGSGGSLRVELTMHQITRPWNPPNGFDHVVFTLFVELPDSCGEVLANARCCNAEQAGGNTDRSETAGSSGASFALQGPGSGSCGLRVMPQQSGELPEDMRWHYRVRAHGWTNGLYSSAGASATNEGRPVIPSPKIETDLAARTVSFTLSSSALGHPRSLSGARLYVNTWDYDGAYRALEAEAGPNRFGGGQPGDPLVMDESGVIELR